MVLLDTCALLWLAGDQDALSDNAKAAISSSLDGPAVSAISAFEIAFTHRQGKLELPLPPEQWYAEALKSHGIREIPVDGACCLAAAALPLIHRDPCDRFVIATAQVHGLSLLTPDRVIARYPDVTVIW